MPRGKAILGRKSPFFIIFIIRYQEEIHDDETYFDGCYNRRQNE